MWGMGQEGFKEEELTFANDIQILTGSRCRRLRVGGMCCQGLVQLRILAAKFCGYWSLSRALNGTPNRTQLPWSSWEVLKSRIKISGMVWSCGWGSRGWIWWHNLCVTHKMSLRRKNEWLPEPAIWVLWPRSLFLINDGTVWIVQLWDTFGHLHSRVEFHMGKRMRPPMKPCGTPLLTQAGWELDPVLKTGFCLLDQHESILEETVQL